jgi:hypothetical protein|tara:strand:- start:133 stop:906 length:774 start_codon:yes stop_codon:yes gene_type:complete
MYGEKYAQNLRQSFLSPTDEQGSDGALMTKVRKSDLKVYEDSQDVQNAALADLLSMVDIKPEVRDEIAAKKAQARLNEMTESTSRALVTDDDEVVTLDEANEIKSLVTKPVISPISTLVFDPETDIDRAVEALRFLESGGKKNPYKAKGKKVTKGQYKGEQAIGAYGVMESNVPLFTKKYYGEELTVEEFINNTKAQDEVAKEFILQNYQKYGNLEDAISTWFTGDPLDQAMDRGADDGSIDIKEYMIRFNRKFNPE